jgi:hypothetical protein
VNQLDFLSGMSAAAFLVCALFFLRFWVRTRDNLFGAFALAFLLLGASPIIAEFLDRQSERHDWMFGLRLIAFLVLIAAILQKNLKPPG